MPRSVNSVAKRARRKKILNQTKGYFGARKNVYTVAKNALEKALLYAYRDRKQNKRNFRSLWIQRINAGAREHGLSYSQFMGKVKSNGIDLNKKAPYSGYISARTAIYPSEIVDRFSILFEKLLENGNLVESYLEMHKNESSFYYKDSKRTFDKAFEKMITDFNNDPVYKANILKENFEQVKKETGKELTNSELELTYKAVMVKMYDKMIKGFEFENHE